MAKSNITANGIDISSDGFMRAVRSTQLSLLDSSIARSKASEMRREMRSINDKLIDRIRRNQLNGQKLKRKTGALQKSLRQTVVASGGVINSQVYSDLEYGQAFDVGSRGIQSIKAHLEHRRSIFGRPTNPYVRFVNQHSRRYDIRAKEFVNEEAQKMVPEIIRTARDIFLKR